MCWVVLFLGQVFYGVNEVLDLMPKAFQFCGLFFDGSDIIGLGQG